MHRRKLLSISLGFAFVLAGCGGGGGGQTASLARAAVTIRWAGRARSISGPASALSATITLTGAALSGGDVQFVVDRDAGPDSYERSYAAPVDTGAGPFPVRVEFHADAKGAGAVVAMAMATVAPGADGQIPTIATQGRIGSVTITPGQSVTIGTPKMPAISILSTTGEALAVSPGSVFLDLSAGGSVVQIIDGQLQGIRPGAVRVSVSVDGVSSPLEMVAIVSDAVVRVTPASTQVNPRQSVPLSASVSGTGVTNVGVIWSVVEGASAGSVGASGVYVAPAAAGTYHVRATSVFDPMRYADAEIVVPSGSVSVGGTFPETGGVGVQIQ